MSSANKTIRMLLLNLPLLDNYQASLPQDSFPDSPCGLVADNPINESSYFFFW